MTIAEPAWLLLLFPLGVALAYLRLPGRALTVLRAATFILVVFAICRPRIDLPLRGGTVIVVADRSASMPEGAEDRAIEIVDLIHEEMPRTDRLGVVSVGDRGVVEQPPQAAAFGGFALDPGRDGSDLAGGLDAALALIPEGTPGRVVVLSDGRGTGADPRGPAGRAATRGIPVDYRALQRPSADDTAIDRIQAPPQVAQGASYMLTAWIRSPYAQEVGYELRSGDGVIARGRRAFKQGLTRLVFRDRASQPGTRAYRLAIDATEADPVPENNTARALVGVTGVRPLLCVTAGAGSGLPGLLRQGGLTVSTPGVAGPAWSLEYLSNYSAVVLENVASNRLGLRSMEHLALWVAEAGGGLMVTGGRNAYGPGGYFRSPLDPVLPVSMELRQEHRKLALAIVMVLDRSGSMAMSAGGGRTKMDLANLGAAQVIDLLSGMDEVGVLAVDSQPHTIVGLQPVDNKGAIRSKILRIDSMGGGIFVYEGLVAAVSMLAKASAGTRHIILFSDAADSEQPGNYKVLLEKCRKANVTVSVIGLGTEADSDAELLKDVAKRGDGRIFFTADPQEIPRLFAQDTFAVARSAFIEDPVVAKTTGGMLGVAGRRLADTFPLGGYNLCYLKPDANLAAVTTDDYAAPVVASWQAGGGRVLCYTGEADGEFTGSFAAWEDAGDFLTSLARWVGGSDNPLPDTMLITQHVRDGTCRVQLHLDPKRGTDPFAAPPVVHLLTGRPGTTPRSRAETMRWSGAALLEVATPLGGDETLLAAVDVPSFDRVALPPVCLPYSAEFAPAPEAKGRDTLHDLAEMTGGEERIDMAAIWNALPKHPRPAELAPWLIVAAIVLFLLEVLHRRTGVLGRGRRTAHGLESPALPVGPGFPARGQQPRGQTAGTAEGRATEGQTDAPSTPGDALSAMRQARARAKRRTER